jgi:hypothetical protein
MYRWTRQRRELVNTVREQMDLYHHSNSREVHTIHLNIYVRYNRKRLRRDGPESGDAS